MPNPTPAYTLEEIVSHLTTVCAVFGGDGLQRSLLHHLRAAQADAARLAKLETLYVAAKAEHESLFEGIDDEELDRRTIVTREALRALGPLKEPMP